MMAIVMMMVVVMAMVMVRDSIIELIRFICICIYV